MAGHIAERKTNFGNGTSEGVMSESSNHRSHVKREIPKQLSEHGKKCLINSQQNKVKQIKKIV